MSSVDIVFVAKADQIPADPLAAAHGEAIEIAIKQSVDGVFLVAFLELAILLPNGVRRASETLDIGVEVGAHVLVEDHEQGDELPVHVLGRTVRIGASTPRDDDGADKAGIDVDAFVIVRMIEPDYGVGSAGPGPARSGTSQ